MVVIGLAWGWIGGSGLYFVRAATVPQPRGAVNPLTSLALWHGTNDTLTINRQLQFGLRL
jgi:hypothetical protein